MTRYRFSNCAAATSPSPGIRSAGCGVGSPPRCPPRHRASRAVWPATAAARKDAEVVEDVLAHTRSDFESAYDSAPSPRHARFSISKHIERPRRSTYVAGLTRHARRAVLRAYTSMAERWVSSWWRLSARRIVSTCCCSRPHSHSCPCVLQPRHDREHLGGEGVAGESVSSQSCNCLVSRRRSPWCCPAAA